MADNSAVIRLKAYRLGCQERLPAFERNKEKCVHKRVYQGILPRNTSILLNANEISKPNQLQLSSRINSKESKAVANALHSSEDE